MTKRVKRRLAAAIIAGVLGVALLLTVIDSTTLEKWLAFPVAALTVIVLDWALDRIFDGKPS